MTKIRFTTRLALLMGLASTLLLWLALDLGFLPDERRAKQDEWQRYSQVVAQNVAHVVQEQQLDTLPLLLNLATSQYPEIESIAILDTQGSVIVASYDHPSAAQQADGSGVGMVTADIVPEQSIWGRVQLVYRPEGSSWFGQALRYPVPLLLFFGSASTLMSWFLIEQMFKYLNPVSVIPLRVRSALDNLAEGLVFVEPTGTIIYANQAFGQLINTEGSQVLGSNIEQFPWSPVGPGEAGFELPWVKCQRELGAVCGMVLELDLVPSEGPKKYRVNASPIFANDSKKLRGVLISFDDVTLLQNRKVELGQIVNTLRKSRDEIAQQNEQLQFLANYDHLTNCFNRRSFWAQYEELWRATSKDQLNIIMIDIDKFKLINDRYGHAAGDEVLENTGRLLREVVGDSGLVFRYGGEEFALLIPDADVEHAARVAWKIHEQFQWQKHEDLNITASLGLSNRQFGAVDLQDLLDQADQCLYAAKRQGRNTVVRFDQCDDLQPVASMEDLDELSWSANIEYSTVTGLLSALAFRCQATAEHSMRVSDLSVAIGRNLLTKRNLYRLEICALLHDIGKIGVPDAILHKPGKLTDDEWEVMKRHDEMAVEIIRSSFASEEVAEIIHCHQRKFNSGTGEGSQGSRLPLESRIIAVCDAFDSMIYDHVYRPRVSTQQAIRELQRCSPEQFDPDVVELLADYVESPTFQNTWKNKVINSLPMSGSAMENQLNKLNEAIEAEDVGMIREVVDSLKTDLDPLDSSQISVAAKKLENAISSQNKEFDQIAELAHEMIDLYGSPHPATVQSHDTVA